MREADKGMFYISNGNIPSTWAHTVQTVKMSAAFARHVRGFRLLIASDLLGLFRPKREIYRWYGVRRPLPIRRIVIAPRLGHDDLQRANVRAFAPAVRRYVQRHRPKLIYTRNHESALSALQDGFAVIFETHDGPGHPKTMRYMAQFAEFENLKGVVTTAKPLAEAFRKAGVRDASLLVEPNGVDTDQFRPRDNDADWVRQRFGWEKRQPVALYVGSLQAHKGIATIIDAARLVPGVKFLIVGGSVETIRDWVQREQPPANVKFVSFVPNSEVPLLVAGSDVCLVANSRSDRTAAWTYSLKLYEYLAAGRPTIVTDIPSLRDAVHDGVAAMIVPPDEPGALAEGVRRIIGEPALAERLGKAGLDLAHEHSWDGRAERILRALAPGLLDH